MFVHSLANCIERAALCWKEKVRTRAVGELEVLRVACEPISAESQSRRSIFSPSISLPRVLLLVDFRHNMVAQPSVHNEVPAALLVNQADNCVRVGHSSAFAEADSCPTVSRLCLDYKLD